MSRVCKDCEFFTVGVKRCQRFPPIIISDASGVFSKITQQWPYVDEYDWCGEWQSKAASIEPQVPVAHGGAASKPETLMPNPRRE